MTVKTLNGKNTQHRNLADFRLKYLNRPYLSEVEEALVGKLLTSSSDIPPSKHDVSLFSHLRDISFDDLDADVKFIIGVKHCEAWLLATDFQRGGQGQPLGLKTLFGWTLLGLNGKSKSNKITCNAIATDDLTLKNKLKDLFYWDFPLVNEEELGESEDNRRAIKMLEESIRFNGRWSLPCPGVTDEKTPLKR